MKQVSAEGPREVVTDKGIHSRAVVSELAEWGVRTYCSEPNRGRQRWPRVSAEEQQAKCMATGGAFDQGEATGNSGYAGAASC